MSRASFKHTEEPSVQPWREDNGSDHGGFTRAHPQSAAKRASELLLRRPLSDLSPSRCTRFFNQSTPTPLPQAPIVSYIRSQFSKVIKRSVLFLITQFNDRWKGNGFSSVPSLIHVFFSVHWHRNIISPCLFWAEVLRQSCSLWRAGSNGVFSGWLKIKQKIRLFCPWWYKHTSSKSPSWCYMHSNDDNTPTLSSLMIIFALIKSFHLDPVINRTLLLGIMWLDVLLRHRSWLQWGHLALCDLLLVLWHILQALLFPPLPLPLAYELYGYGCISWSFVVQPFQQVCFSISQTCVCGC